MFEQITIPKSSARTPWMVACALMGQLLALGLLIAIPMIYVQALPIPDLTATLVAPPPPPPPPPPPAALQPRAAKVPARTFDASRLLSPTTIPKQVATIQDLAAAPQIGATGGVPGGVAGGVAGGVIGGILNSVPMPAPGPPPPPPLAAAAAAAPTAPIRIGGAVEAALFIGGPQPVYPMLAKQARVQGNVLLDAIIGADGTIKDLRVVSGNALLISAAMDAVKHWTYRPTILNGKPVDIATEIVVQFSLS